MAKIQTKIFRWDGGMKSDIRDRAANSARLIKNFDPITYPYRLEPYRASESGNDTVARELNNFLLSNARLYGYGVQSGTAKTKLWYKETNDFQDDTWVEPANGESGAFTRETELFVFYSYGGAGYIFGGQTNRIWKFAVDGSAFTDADASITHTSISQGKVHSKDDILYVPYDNFIASKDGAAAWNATALTLPTEYVTRGVCEYGNALAIPVRPLATGSGKTTSRVFLWNLTDTEPYESIDFGAGNLEVLEELNGDLIGIMELGNRLIIKRATTLGAETIMDFAFDSGTVVTLTQRKQKKNDRIYFMMTAILDGVTHYGVWAIGKNKLGQWCLYLDRTPNNDTDPGSIAGFFLVDSSGLEYMFQAYTDGSSNKQVSKTRDDVNFTTTSIVETVKYNQDLPGEEKLLKGVTVAHEALPANGSVAVKAKVDDETSFTTVFTNTTENSMRHSAVNIESTGGKIPDYNEIQWRIEVKTTGGLEGATRVLQLEFLSEVKPTKPYE